MVEKEIFATKYTPSTLKIGVKKPQKYEKRQKFPHYLLVMILGRPSLHPQVFGGLESCIYSLKEDDLLATANERSYYSER